jgi:hypothetical protein
MSRIQRRRIDIPPLALLDKQWDDQGIRAQRRKSCDLERSGTVLGIDLVNGLALTPQLKGFVSILTCGVDLITERRASPRAVSGLLGKLQWNDLLNRFLLSCFHHVYEFVRSADFDRVVDLPPEVLAELALNLSLWPYWIVDLTRGWMDVLPVTDASESYGFGLCAANVAPSLTREVASQPYDEDVHVRCTPEAGAPHEIPRVGATYRLPFALSKFRPLLAQRATFKAHSGGLDASAVAQGMRTLSRDTRLHSRRGAFLVDARAVMGALRKGRSSAPTLRHPICRVAALCLACDWTWRFHYVPSESNAADWPSRGKVYRQERARQRRRTMEGHNGRVRKYSKLERALTKERAGRKFIRNLLREKVDAGEALPSPASSSSVSLDGADIWL